MKFPFKDPLGQAIIDFHETGIDADITVSSEICDDDIIQSSYLLREYNDMPKLEQIAISQCSGKIIDVGAGAGMHAKWLQENKQDIACIDVSPLAVEFMQLQELNAECVDFYDLKNKQYDTILMLMNGIGITGKLNHLISTLNHAKSILNPGGKIICDSSDIKYLYEDDEGGMWMDLNSEYYGDFKFQMTYKNHQTDWFDWLYVDAENLKKHALIAGFETTIIFEGENQYLAELKLIE